MAAGDPAADHPVAVVLRRVPLVARWAGIMPYTVEITTPSMQIDGEEHASRMYQLPDPFSTVAEAKEAAVDHIKGLGLDPAGVLYNVFDREGFTVASSLEKLAEAG